MSKIIKCMFFVLLAAVLPLSVHAQQVTLHLQDVTVRKAFRELEVKGNVSLVYEKNDVDLTRKRDQYDGQCFGYCLQSSGYADTD